jgi:hypothetical protein
MIDPALLDSISAISDPGPYGVKMTGLDMVDNPSAILKLVKQDHGLAAPKKQHLMTMLSSPEAFDHIMVGITGMMIAKAAGSYSGLSKPARTLLSLAGFGIGNIIYNTLQERKFTTYDPHTGILKVK